MLIILICYCATRFALIIFRL